MNDAQLAFEIRRDEGEKLRPYDDITGKVIKPGDTLVGLITIGVGCNLSDGISSAESDMLFRGRLDKVVKEAFEKMPWLKTCPDSVQRGVCNLLYNTGWPKLSGFKNMLKALEERRWDDAAYEALNSRWATQVGARATRIAEQFRGAGS